jgi:hypothetical protein
MAGASAWMLEPSLLKIDLPSKDLLTYSYLREENKCKK